MSDFKAPVPIPVGYQFPVSRPNKWYYLGVAIAAALAVFIINR